MFYEYLKNINHVEIFPILGFFIFFIFFIAVSVHTIRLKKSDTEELAKIPLDDGINNTENN
jgi:hypothetical protein